MKIHSPVSPVLLALTLLAAIAGNLSAGALQLDGTVSYVTFPGTGIPSGSQAFTIEAWINPTTIPTGGEDGGQITFWGNQSGNQANGFRLRGPAGVRHFFWGNDHDENFGTGILPDSTGPNADGWHHLALTFDGAQTRWYWNGNPLGNPRTASGVNVTAANHRIGSRLNAEFFHGFIDEVRIWNRARSAIEIAQDRDHSLDGSEANLVAYFDFEEDLSDRAGGNNNGTGFGNAVVNLAINAPIQTARPKIYSFAAGTNFIFLGQSTTLTWHVSNATSVVIAPGIGPVAPEASTAVSPSVTTTYTLTATNADGASTADVSIQVDPGVPIAFNLTTNTPRDTPLDLTLAGFDPQGSNFLFAIVTPPTHGALAGTPPQVTYSPSTGFQGLDTFTFKVNDGAFDSEPGTVSINVIPSPTPPTGITLSSTNIPLNTGPGSFIAALRAVDVNIPDGDTHTFALVPGFADNAQFAIAGNVLLAGPAFAGGPGAAFSIRLQATDSAGLNFEQTFALAVAAVPRGLVINEIHYNSDDNTLREEFIEIYNPTAHTVDISLWRVRDGVDYFFPLNTFVAPGSFIVVAEDPATLLNRYGVTAFGPWDGLLNNEGEEIILRDALDEEVDRVDFRSRFPWPIAANGDGASMQLVHPNLDNDLGSSWRSGAAPTPGATNLVFAENAAPNLRQVNHSPNTPTSGAWVTVTCKVTDPEGVAEVTLAYQVVAPGRFLPATLPLTAAQLNSINSNPTLTNALNPVFEAASNWVTVVMRDDGLNGDALANDDLFTAVLPQQAHRTLVRYRITVADLLGATRRAPFEDDPALNFAYFVYDGLPDYQQFTAESLQTLPVYSLITRDTDLNECAAWFSPWSGTHQLPQGIGSQRNEGRLHFNWEGAIVHEGVVYDHIKYRLRGANGRYHPGKRNFRFRFNSGHYLDAKDQKGNRFPTPWRELTTGKGQSNRGTESFALNEVINFYLWNKVGVPAPRTFHFHFRVIDGEQESPADPYAGDFWGLNWAQEKYDVNFLESHGLEKGNLYKLVDNYVLGVDERRYQGPFAVTNAADFYNIENNLSGFQSVDWLLAHANYPKWYRYFAIAEAIRHYDTWPSANKNGAWYFEPIYTPENGFLGRLWQLPYDSTDTWGPTWNTGEDVLFSGIFPSSASGGDSGQHPELQLEYRNVVREVRDLLFQPDQINAIIDAHAAAIRAVAAADHARWRYAPAPANYTSLYVPSSPGVTAGLDGYVQDMKNFMFVGGSHAWWIDRQTVGAGGWVTRLDQIAAADTAVPNQPTLAYIGTNSFAVDDLVFQSSPFADPQGGDTFGAMQWRIAEVLAPGTVLEKPAQLKLEWDAAWTSDEFTTFNAFVTIPPQVVRPDLLYRVRVRHKDTTGRWSRWSAPIEFRPGPRDLFTVLRTNLVFAEVMYHPPGDGTTEGDEFEFVELKNIGAVTLDLTGLSFSDGITYSFPDGTALAPGERFLLARNPAVLATRYPGVTVHGTYSGRLDNGGETLAISHPVAGEIIRLEYDDRAPWPVAADGHGFSLVRADSGTYAAGADRLGTPGAEGEVSPLGGVVINEVLSSSSAPLLDTIELLNTAATSVDLSGWFLSDDPSYPWKFRIPLRAPLLPGEFALFDESDFNPTPGLGTSFSLSSFGEEVYLFSADATAQLSGYSHGFSFGAAQDGVSFGRHLNSLGEEQFPLQIARTLPGPNAGPRVGPVVISEVHYHPRSPADEFLELYNPTGTPVSLYDPAFPTNRWELSGASFTFPPGTTLAAGRLLLLVADDPSAFRARFALPSALPVFQYAGTLQDSGENLEVRAPDMPTSNGVPYYAVDAVRYNDRKPWPLAGDGAGASLQRLDPDAYGNDPVNWVAARPTPGTYGLTGTPPAITSHPQSRTNGTTTTAFFTVSATGTPPLFYQWRGNGANIDEATNATLALPNLTLEDAGIYQAVVFNAAGSVDTSNAQLTVRVGPSITNHPVDAQVRVPPDPQAPAIRTATFAVEAVSYNPPLAYQWQFNGVDLPDATNRTLTLNDVELPDAGLYTAVVSDNAAATVSQPAELVALVRPAITLAPPNLSVVTGAVVSVNAAASGSPLPFGWEWRRVSAVIASNEFNRPFDFFNFVNTNPPGSTISYRVVVRSLSGLDNRLFSLTTLADTDADGMPDAWETLYGLNPNDPADRDLDADLDGATNAGEYTAGTHPTNAASFLRLEFSAASGQPTLAFGAVSNLTYTAQYSEHLHGAPWLPLQDIFALPTNRVEIITDPAWTHQRFYRIVTPRQQ